MGRLSSAILRGGETQFYLTCWTLHEVAPRPIYRLAGDGCPRARCPTKCRAASGALVHTPSPRPRSRFLLGYALEDFMPDKNDIARVLAEAHHREQTTITQIVRLVGPR